jgi:hypothetical protein
MRPTVFVPNGKPLAELATLASMAIEDSSRSTPPSPRLEMLQVKPRRGSAAA